MRQVAAAGRLGRHVAASLGVGLFPATAPAVRADTAPLMRHPNAPADTAAPQGFDLDTQADRTIVTGLDNHSLSAAGGSAAFRRDGAWHVASNAAGIPNHNTLDLSSLRMTVDPRREWTGMFGNAWRLDRDVFFSRAMNGDGWRAVHDAPARLLPQLGSRDDVSCLPGADAG